MGIISAGEGVPAITKNKYSTCAESENCGLSKSPESSRDSIDLFTSLGKSRYLIKEKFFADLIELLSH